MNGVGLRMLNLLIEGFDKHVCLAEDADTIQRRLHDEKARLMDPGHLQREVIGEPRWAWDFEALDEGFLQLAGPFMEREAGLSHLYLQTLREFGDFQPEHEHVIILLEYAHYASLIEDYYNFNEAFAEPVLDPRRCSRLTQVKFAGQYLTLYPSYLLIRNMIRADERTLIRMHRWRKNMFITCGISRGVLLKWLGARFGDVQKDHYFQNSINAACMYFLSPIVMGAIVAGQTEDTVRQLKEAVSWLTLSVKLRCERRAILGQLDPALGPHHEKALLPLTLPGTLFLQKGLRLQNRGDRPATMAAVHEAMLTQVQSGLAQTDLAELEEQEHRFFTEFSDRMRRIGCASGLVKRLACCLGWEEVGS